MTSEYTKQIFCGRSPEEKKRRDEEQIRRERKNRKEENPVEEPTITSPPSKKTPTMVNNLNLPTLRSLTDLTSYLTALTSQLQVAHPNILDAAAILGDVSRGKLSTPQKGILDHPNIGVSKVDDVNLFSSISASIERDVKYGNKRMVKLIARLPKRGAEPSGTVVYVWLKKKRGLFEQWAKRCESDTRLDMLSSFKISDEESTEEAITRYEELAAELTQDTLERYKYVKAMKGLNVSEEIKKVLNGYDVKKQNLSSLIKLLRGKVVVKREPKKKKKMESDKLQLLSDSALGRIFSFLDPWVAMSVSRRTGRMITSLVTSRLNVIQFAPELTHLDFSYENGPHTLKPLRKLSVISHLKISSFPRNVSLKPIGKLHSLTFIHLIQCCNLTSIEALKALPHLTEIRLHSCSKLTSIEPLRQAVQLTSIHLNQCGITSIEPLRAMHLLTDVIIYSCGGLTTLNALGGLRNITQISLGESLYSTYNSGKWSRIISSLEFLREMRKLTHLKLDHVMASVSLEPLRGLHKLTHIEFISCYGISSLEPLRKLQNLTHVNFSRCLGIKSYLPVRDLPNLTHVNFP